MSAGDWKRRQIDGQLPEELTIEIFSRLPGPAAVARCSCVSKSWRRILSHPEFTRKSIMPPPPPSTARVMIARSSSTTPGTMSYSAHSSSDLRPLSSGALPVGLGDASSKPFIAGCCRGVFCIGDGSKTVVLWNPTNCETYTLPSIPPPVGRRRGRFTKPVGFGFDPVANDYKVLVSFSTVNRPFEFFVYRLWGNSYKQVKGYIPEQFSHKVVPSLSCSPVTCHWISEASSSTGYCYYIFTSFDMSREVFTQLHLPKPSDLLWWVFEKSFHMGRDGSCLVAVFFGMKKKGKGMLFLDVWATPSYVALAEGECSWIRLYNIDSLPRAAALFASRLDVPGLWKHGKLFARCSTTTDSSEEEEDDELCVIDLERKKDWVLKDLEIKLGKSDYLQLFAYLPSTMFLNGLARGKRYGERTRCQLIK